MAGEAAGDEAAPTTDGELKSLEESVRLLPTAAIKELSSLGVCTCCIFRLLGIYEHISSRPSLSTSVLTDFVQKVIRLEKDEENDSSTKNEGLSGQQSSNEHLIRRVCKICLGILDFVYHDEKGMLIKKDCANEFATVIAEAVKREHGQIDSFSLEVSLPSLVMENEQVVWSYIRKKYASELGSFGNSVSGNISTKDALKLSIVHPLEKLLGAKSKISSFRIRFTYSSPEELAGADIELINGCKRRKTGNSDAINTNYTSEPCGTEKTNDQICEQEKIKTSTDQMEDHGIDQLKYQLEKVNQPYRLVVLCYRCPIYIGGRYLKYSRNVSQTRWIIDDERKGEASVEEIVGGNILSLCQGDSYKFHAAGREDIDVRMLGTGRPFLVEIQNARQVPSDELINQIEKKINNLENKLVGIKNLKILGSKGWELMREGETEKQKQYAALVWISRPLNSEDLQTLSSPKDMQILQKTPIRVLHRRSPLEREKIIHWMKVERIAGSSQYFLLHLCTQAGTYIKEFVHGDLGRTNPSIGSILGCRAEILQLDVTDVKMDCF